MILTRLHFTFQIQSWIEVVATFVGIFLYFIPFKNIFDFVMILVNKVTNKYRNPKIITKLTPTRFRAECNDGIILFRGHFVALTVHFPPWWIMAGWWIIASISRVDICKNCFGNLLKRSHWGLALVLIWSMTGTFCCPLGYRCDFRSRWHYYYSFYKKRPLCIISLKNMNNFIQKTPILLCNCYNCDESTEN